MSLRPTRSMCAPWSARNQNASTPNDRVDWSNVRDRIDLVAVATALLGPAPGRRGERSAQRLWWPCPFHEDSNPSFCVTPGNPGWKCFGCGEYGDAAALVIRLRGVAFPEAVRWLAEQSSILPAPRGMSKTGPKNPAVAPRKAVKKPTRESSGLALSDALNLVTEAEERLWKPEGSGALVYLKGRGLTEKTIRAARLGWTPRVTVPKRDGVGYFRSSGVTIPWWDGDRLALVKIRQPEGDKPRYVEAYRERPRIYPGPEAIRPGAPLVIAEGEFDALLLGQELEELAAVVTLGSASSTRPEPASLALMLPAPVWYLATDADAAGEKAASEWPGRTRRARPPAPDNDWTEAAQAGIDLRRWWIDRLGGIENPERSTWDELAKRHGPGIVIDRTAPPTLTGLADSTADESDRQERAAIMEFDGGLSREAAERSVGLS